MAGGLVCVPATKAGVHSRGCGCPAVTLPNDASLNKRLCLGTALFTTDLFQDYMSVLAVYEFSSLKGLYAREEGSQQ